MCARRVRARGRCADALLGARAQVLPGGRLLASADEAGGVAVHDLRALGAPGGGRALLWHARPGSGGITSLAAGLRPVSGLPFLVRRPAAPAAPPRPAARPRRPPSRGQRPGRAPAAPARRHGRVHCQEFYYTPVPDSAARDVAGAGGPAGSTLSGRCDVQGQCFRDSAAAASTRTAAAAPSGSARAGAACAPARRARAAALRVADTRAALAGVRQSRGRHQCVGGRPRGRRPDAGCHARARRARPQCARACFSAPRMTCSGAGCLHVLSPGAAAIPAAAYATPALAWRAEAAQRVVRSATPAGPCAWCWSVLVPCLETLPCPW